MSNYDLPASLDFSKLEEFNNVNKEHENVRKIADNLVQKSIKTRIEPFWDSLTQVQKDSINYYFTFQGKPIEYIEQKWKEDTDAELAKKLLRNKIPKGNGGNGPQPA